MCAHGRENGRNRYRSMARLMRALANESRLIIVDRLSRGECCVCELAELTGLDQSTVSRHMSRLESSNVVERERRGQHVYFRLVALWVKELLDSHSPAAGPRRAPMDSHSPTADPDKDTNENRP
jgi:ArsR family transcriptional regulator